MRRSPFAIALATCTAVLFALIALAAGYTLMGGDWPGGESGRAGSVRYEKQTYQAQADGLRSVSIACANNAIELRPSRDGTLRVTYYTSPYDEYGVSDEGGELRVEHRSVGLPIFSFSFQDTTVIVELPQGFDGDVSLITTNGRITLDGADVSGYLTARTSNARIDAENLRAQGTIRLITSNGLVDARYIEAASFEADTSNGAITLRDAVASQEIYLRTNNASITVDGIEAGSAISLRTSNSSIRGSVAGSMEDYSITARTKNSSSNLPASTRGGGKTLDVNTSNGGIHITFDG